MLESFDDYLGFIEHQSSTHHDELMQAFGDRVESFWIEWFDPIQGASPLVTTHSQELPDDATERMRQAAQRMPVEVASWWLPLR